MLNLWLFPYIFRNMHNYAKCIPFNDAISKGFK